MSLQRFEDVVPNDKRLAMLLDLLRYENASQAERIAILEVEISGLRDRLAELSEMLEKQQRYIDLRNAEWPVEE